MHIVSLFDGISCGYVAAEKAGLTVDSYTAYEIDRAAITVSDWNYPQIIRGGDVLEADFRIHRGPRRLLIGGSPCQKLSWANPLRVALEHDETQLFWEYKRAKEEIDPDYFVFENVASMAKSDRDIISQALGVQPIKINSALVSAQTRNRLYWTNIPGVDQPEDRGLSVQDILETSPSRKYKVNDTPSRRKMWAGKCKNLTHARKSACLTTDPDTWSNGGLIAFEDFCRYLTPLEYERLQGLPDGYTEMVSDRAAYIAIGNGWQTDTVAHIFNYINLAAVL